jgi:hypothetical protein
MLFWASCVLLEDGAIRCRKCCKRTIFKEKLLVVRAGISRYLSAPVQYPKWVVALQAVILTAR